MGIPKGVVSSDPVYRKNDAIIVGRADRHGGGLQVVKMASWGLETPIQVG
jgi:hypothetical protein